MKSKTTRPARVGPLTHIHHEPGAWSVHVMRAGVLYSDYFSNAVYGGWRKSLLAARRFRDGLLTRIPPDTRVRRRVPKGARSETGIPGVTLERYRVDGREYERFVASWQNADGECQRRRFSVGRYGKEVAEALATAERNKGVETARREKQARQRGGGGAQAFGAAPRFHEGRRQSASRGT